MSLLLPDEPAKTCQTQRSWSHTISRTIDRLSDLPLCCPAADYGQPCHSQWLQSKLPIQPGTPRSLFYARMRVMSSSVVARRYVDSYLFTINSMKLLTAALVVDFDSRTYSSGRSAASPLPRTRSAATTF